MRFGMEKILFLSMFVFYSCSSNPLQTRSSKTIPEWVHAPMEKCSESREICASASGDSIEEADLNAKKSLASIFETKITSKFEVNTTSTSNQDKDELEENVYSTVQESIDQVLTAVEIKKRYVQDNSFFSLASLDKNKAAKTIRLEMRNIDDQLDFLYKKGHRTSIKKMLILFNRRELLNERLILLNKAGLASKYSFQQINALKFKEGKSKISINYSDAFPLSLQKWFENLMNDSGYKVVKEPETYYQLRLGYLAKEEYLKVKGFKKFQFTTTGEAKNSLGQKIGTFSVSILSTGRNQNDAFQRIRAEMLNQIEQNIDKLNME